MKECMETADYLQELVGVLKPLKESEKPLEEALSDAAKTLLEKRGKEMEEFMKEHKLHFISREEAEAAQTRQ